MNKDGIDEGSGIPAWEEKSVPCKKEVLDDLRYKNVPKQAKRPISSMINDPEEAGE